jgi:small-conductance mechanosensitive channel
MLNFQFLYDNGLRLIQLLCVGLLIFGYWIFYNTVINYVNRKYSSKIASFTNTSVLILAMLLTIFTVYIAFSSSIGVLVSGISFLSAAIVFALQDLFASFFAWVYINTSDQYSVGDSILITSDTRVIYGVVMDVGVFRTTLLEKVGDGSLDTEMNTGKIITFPNRFVHKHSLTNLTKNHLLIQHKFDFTIEYDQDYKTAKKLIFAAVNQVYAIMEDDEHKFLDPHLPEDVSYTPKVYTHLNDSGITYTIWFACKVGMKRSVLELYSEAILETLEANNIKLAFNTMKILQQK